MAIYNVHTDQELIAFIKERDNAAFAELYERYGIMLFYKVNQMLRDEESAKDVVQDVFTTIWEKPENIQDGANLAGYLYIACRNRVLKLIQKGKTRNDYLTELGRYSKEVDYNTIQQIDERELMLLISAEIAKLPPKMRKVFQLSRIEDLSHKEIALQLGISEATVRKQVQYALSILRNKLGGYSTYAVLLLAMFNGH
ncbi:RNA polymerase sigma-70 factor [Pedobacter heparinus]|uniref:RNA polymerase sigma factor n=1 Tax=Pedobacter heparinus TaxID=984 RepID=UPI00292EFC96|nr:RNA polymerase sigma-70 factor [Pedobacter heparinus]